MAEPTTDECPVMQRNGLLGRQNTSCTATDSDEEATLTTSIKPPCSASAPRAGVVCEALERARWSVETLPLNERDILLSMLAMRCIAGPPVAWHGLHGGSCLESAWEPPKGLEGAFPAAAADLLCKAARDMIPAM